MSEQIKIDKQKKSLISPSRKNQLLNSYNDAIPGRQVLHSNNSLLTIHPYYHNGSWVFDDSRTGLIAEPFVSGADDLIDYLLNLKQIREKALKNGFTAIFGIHGFRGAEICLQFKYFESGGSVYEPRGLDDFRNAQGTREVWFCPALKLYFADSPEDIWIRINEYLK